MADSLYGYVSGPRTPVQMRVATGSAIAVGDLVKAESDGYITVCAAGDNPIGVAMEACTAPSADGGRTILVDISPLSIYRYPPDTGTVSQALVGKTCDVGGVQSINIDASADDCIYVARVNTDENTLHVRLIYIPTGVA